MSMKGEREREFEREKRSKKKKKNPNPTSAHGKPPNTQGFTNLRVIYMNEINFGLKI